MSDGGEIGPLSFDDVRVGDVITAFRFPHASALPRKTEYDHEAITAIEDGRILVRDDVTFYTRESAGVWRDIEIWVIRKAASVTDSRFPHDCLYCGRKAYVSALSVDHADGRSCF